MANRNDEKTAFHLERVAGNVVLSMTPQGAQRVAASIWLGDADHSAWLGGLADLLRAAAQETNFFAESWSRESGHDHPAALGTGIRGAAATERGNAPDLTSSTGGSEMPPEVQAAAAFAEALGLAAEAAAVTKVAVAASANLIHEAAQAARAVQAATANEAARATAETVKQTALALRVQTQHEAEKVARAAIEAASLVVAATTPGTEDVDAEKAAFMAATIHAAAVAKAEEAALAAATVARAAATAAAAAAATAADAAMALELQVADAAMALELQVADTAAAVQALANVTARREAIDRVRAADIVFAAR